MLVETEVRKAVDIETVPVMLQLPKEMAEAIVESSQQRGWTPDEGFNLKLAEASFEFDGFDGEKFKMERKVVMDEVFRLVKQSPDEKPYDPDNSAYSRFLFSITGANKIILMENLITEKLLRKLLSVNPDIKVVMRHTTRVLLEWYDKRSPLI